MKYFLSCDWGTTSLKLRLTDVSNGKVLAGPVHGCGIADTFSLWKEIGDKNAGSRQGFYLKILGQHIKKLEEENDFNLSGVKLIISGMASSTIGFIDLPYAPVPLKVDGSGVKTSLIAANEYFNHDVLVISGVTTGDDVMRGEETQLIGCIATGTEIKNELFIFPGTHSKHIHVKNNEIIGFKTYMTGEFFDLLSQKSILRSAVENNAGHEDSEDLKRFKDGVKHAANGNLLHTAFKVRTNNLFSVFNKHENYNYLSGLIIGTELKDLLNPTTAGINLVCCSNLAMYYSAALDELGLSPIVTKFPDREVDTTAVTGQYKIGHQLNFLP